MNELQSNVLIVFHKQISALSFVPPWLLTADQPIRFNEKEKKLIMRLQEPSPVHWPHE